MRRILNQLLLKTGTPPWHLQLPLSPGLHKYACRVRVKRAERQICTRFCRIHFNVNGNRRVSKDKHLQFFLSPHNGWEFSMMLAQVFHEFRLSRTQTIWRVVYPIVGYKLPDHLGIARHFGLELTSSRIVVLRGTVWADPAINAA